MASMATNTKYTPISGVENLSLLMDKDKVGSQYFNLGFIQPGRRNNNEDIVSNGTLN